MLQPLIISKVRLKLLKIFLHQLSEIFYIRQLVRLSGEEINAVRRELQRLEAAGMLKKEPRGNRLYYWFNKRHPLFGDLLSIISKTVGLGGQIVANKNKLGRINFALLSGRFARHLPTREGEVDLLVIGEIKMALLADLVKQVEKKLKREINYSVMSRQEFEFRRKRRDPFLLGILTGSRIMLVGDEEDLVGRVPDV